ncbi:pseudaminic acid cytidylyltransferase [Pontiellaceae bacterium B12227]|nr:pseudaminic acid cytidylyltransferase [Pontiellaceae bacterium B12227]
MNVCIIPARGGSKRIPNKNIREFCGKPMIAHSIEAANNSAVFDRIIVSTDSDEIGAVAKKWGAEVPFTRPEELSNDHATTDSVIQHALNWFGDHGGLPDHACCLYATAPFVQPEFLIQGLEILQETQATSAFSVTSFSFPIFRGLQVNSTGALEMIWPEHRLTRSQDLPETYHDAGQFYWVNVEKYIQAPSIYAVDAAPVILPRYRVQDIDTPEDWTRAELMYQAMSQ